MEISRDIEIIDLALFLVKKKILVIADLHIGYEEALQKEGILVPRFQFKDIFEKLKKILEKTRPEKIIINGDLKHEFGEISRQEWSETLKILDLLSEYSKEIILIKGNHDTILGPIAAKRNIEVVKKYKTDDILIVHGDKLVDVDKTVKTIIIGHEHPAISLRRGIRQELFKCFLKGSYKGKKLVVMPSFCLVAEGTDIMKEKILSPFLNQSLDNFDVYVIADTVYWFGEIKNLG